MSKGKYEFLKNFVENDIQYEDIIGTPETIESFKECILELDIPVDDLDEEEFYEIKDTLIDMYSKVTNLINNNNMEDDTMKNINEEVVATEEMTIGEKAKAFAEGAKDKLADGFKFVVENVDGAADEVKRMANMSDKELEAYLKVNSKSVLDKIVNKVRGFMDKSKEDGKTFSFFSDVANDNADKAKNIIDLIRDVLDEDELSGWGKFKAIVKELAKWLVRLFLKVGAIVLKIAFTLVVGAVKIGATAIVTAGKALGIVNKEMIKPSVKAGKDAWNNHKARKEAKEEELEKVERVLFDDEEFED